jgi:GT2 family glycosyltransferase
MSGMMSGMSAGAKRMSHADYVALRNDELLSTSIEESPPVSAAPGVHQRTPARVAADVLVVIVNWNSGENLRRCLDALAHQRANGFRTVVVDNGSGDGSAALAEGGLPDVDLFRVGKNEGFARGNNLAFARAVDCKWIALLNPDAYAEPDWLERLLDAARDEPDYAFFASRLLCARDPTLLDGAGDEYHTSGLMWRRGHRKLAAGAYQRREEAFSACGAAALFRRDAILAAGGFDEDFFCYVEDADLAFRLRLLGHRCLYVPDAVVRHVGSAASGVRSDFSLYHGHRNLVWCYIKNMPGALFWLYLPMHLLLNVITLIWFTLEGRGRIIFKAKWDALRGLPRAWQKRKAVQKKRVASLRDIRRAMVKGFSVRT